MHVLPYNLLVITYILYYKVAQGVSMDKRLKLLEKLEMLLMGHRYIGDEKKEGWKEPAAFYAFKCPKHGMVKNYVQGKGRLECPECLKENQLESEPKRRIVA